MGNDRRNSIPATGTGTSPRTGTETSHRTGTETSRETGTKRGCEASGTGGQLVQVGVKFCGGCNPRYDRGAFYQRMKGAYSAFHFEVAQPEVQYDHLLVICGCTSACADISQLQAKEIHRVVNADWNFPQSPESC